MGGGKLYEEHLLDVRFQLGDFFSIDTPDMHRSVLAPRHNVLRIRSERAFDYGRLVDKAGQVILLNPIERIQQHDHVIRCGYEQQVPAIAEFHDFYLTVLVQLPVAEWSSFAFFGAE